MNKLLIADDSPTVTGILSFLFGGEGFEVVAASDGVEAIEKFYRELPDLLILDLEMPRMTGYQVCRIIKDDPEVSKVPIVILTSRDMQSVRFRAMSAGADAHILKNLQDDELLTTVKRLVQKSPWLTKPRPSLSPPDDDEILQRTNRLLDHRLFLAQIIGQLQSLHDRVYDFEAVVKGVMHLFGNIFEFNIGGLLLADSEQQADLFLLTHSEATKDLTMPFVEFLLGFARENAKNFRTVSPRIIRLELDIPHIKAMPRSEGIYSKLAWPINAHSEVIGVLAMAASSPIKFDPNGLEVMAAFIKHSAIIIDNAILMRRQAEINRELRETLAELQSTQAQLIQSEKLASLGQLMAGLVHEMNNPLNFVHGNITYIKTYSEGLLKLVDACLEAFHGNLPEQVKAVSDEIDIPYIRDDYGSLLNDCEEGLRRARGIINDLRTFSAHDRGDMAMVDLRDIIGSTLNILNHDLQTTTDVELDYDPPFQIECNGGQIGQVIMNLLTNSIQAIRDKGVARGNIKISLRKSGDWAELSVTDSGIGINEENKPKLFQPFFTTREVGHGIGLGLSITHGIVARHNGRLEIESEVGVGTTVKIILPIAGRLERVKYSLNKNTGEEVK